MYQVLEITTMPAVLPWGMFAGLFMGGNPEIDAEVAEVGFWLSVVCTVCFVVSLWRYVDVCERASKELYNLRNFNNGRVFWRWRLKL